MAVGENWDGAGQVNQRQNRSENCCHRCQLHVEGEEVGQRMVDA